MQILLLHVRAGVVNPRDVGRAAVAAAERWRADPASAAGDGNPAVGEELQPPGSVVEDERGCNLFGGRNAGGVTRLRTTNGLQIRARNGYYIGSSKTEPDDTRKLDMALFSPVEYEYTALPISVRMARQSNASAPGKKKAHFLFSLPPGAVRVGEEQANKIGLEFASVARDPKGEIVESFGRYWMAR